MKTAAKRAGISQPSWWALENQVTKKPKADTLMRVAVALGVRYTEIIASQPGKQADLEADLIETFRLLDPPNRHAVLAAAKALLDSKK
jgi:transcriptional regulator with XRE-family HTH domain